ncbi:hypothetical protein CK203_061062 [Vitis vinifera]|uniref:Disease resistance protein n=1 Tax=Vitis vinifera TaxID=29760 RepID=A0A438GLG7_VITVI|nr:hypothetical protein CK203_061062 [Vitis vinifera]
MKEGKEQMRIVFCKLQTHGTSVFAKPHKLQFRWFYILIPILEHMVVEECPKMKIFSSSPITTPRLERVEVADDEWHWQDDLNTTIP